MYNDIETASLDNYFVNIFLGSRGVQIFLKNPGLRMTRP